jgi:hypothetical protein
MDYEHGYFDGHRLFGLDEESENLLIYDIRTQKPELHEVNTFDGYWYLVRPFLIDN